MSYEGYEQVLCRNGHLHSCDCYEFMCYEQADSEDENSCYTLWHCPTCGEIAAWINSVDVTNGSWDVDECGDEVRIDGYVELEELSPAETCSCPQCGHTHVVSKPTYRIPKNTGRMVNLAR
jgi:hypothetical protein